MHDTCGSEPAREGVMSVTSAITDTSFSRAGSLPQRLGCIYLALATFHAPSILPSPVMSPAFLSITKVYNGMPW
ncbi:hypothetical protein PS865_04086 [Pseudomonas fluorescens]|nr:hypothetical protein PS865_04086 [Pseudomonas fluorescens]